MAAANLKEARLGLDVFGRKADSYDPAFDPIVRVQMGRLRAKLRAYYNGEGVNDPVRIDIPVGSYAAAFSDQSPRPLFTRFRRRRRRLSTICGWPCFRSSI